MRSWLIAVPCVLVAACGGSSKGTFPSVTDAVRETAPSITGTSGNALTYADGWGSLGWSQPGGRIKEVLADPSTGQLPITNIYQVLSSLDGIIERINSENSDGENFVDCTKEITGAVNTPWWDDHQVSPFFASELVAGTFQCYIESKTASNTDYIAVGREATTGDCADPTIYHLITGMTFTEAAPEPMQGIPDRGGKALGMSTVTSFNACTGDIQLHLAQGGGYENGSVFSSRTEVIGNRAAHDFRLRVLIVGREGSGALEYGQVVGAGVSRGAGSNLVLSWADPSGTNNRTFCLKGTETDGAFAAANDCTTALETRYSSIAPYLMTSAEVPLATTGSGFAPPFTMNAAAFGL